MIPKIIHYCWFGKDPLPPIAIKCINSWKKYCNGYEIVEWNETNFDFNITTYSREASEMEKWAFVADIVRYYTIYQYGGVYLDIDVELLKPIDPLLENDMYIGFENDSRINSGQGFGAIKNFQLVKKMLDFYENKSLKECIDIPSPIYTTKIMKEEGFIINNTKQSINNIVLYSTEYLCPKDWYTGEINITDNTYTIHHFLASWWDKKVKKNHELYKFIKKYRPNQKNLI